VGNFHVVKHVTFDSRASGYGTAGRAGSREMRAARAGLRPAPTVSGTALWGVAGGLG